MKIDRLKYAILVVDDESSMRLLLQAILEGEGYQVTPAQNGKEATALLEKRQFDLIISDSRMPELDGMALLNWVKSHPPPTSVIILTAFGSVENAVEFMKMGAIDYLMKPLKSPDELRLLVARVLRERSLRSQNELLLEENRAAFPCGSMVTQNIVMQKALELASQVAPTLSTVLLLGESGTGKELLARCIHAGSSRAEKVFVPVNCAALSPSLLESELFGHEKGAFTGAMAQHLGRFERAQGGTLFLDEIGELELSLQAKLLRVLEQKEFERVGGNRIISVDVRIIAATNRDLKAALLLKSFREDLYYRLSTFPIVLPPLRERLDDLPCLVEYLIHKVSKRMGKQSKLLDEEAWAALRHYCWPGNVRELENVLERAMIVSRNIIIMLDDLPFVTAPDQVKPKTLAQIEQKAILETMAQNDGHQRKAAEQLGISLRTLQYRLREYGS